MNLSKFSLIVFSLAFISCSKKDKRTEPPPPQPPPSLYVTATAYTTHPAGANYESKIWKDGVQTELKDVNGNIMFGYFIIKDRDMYVFKTETVNNLKNIKYWKNGVATIVASVPTNTSYIDYFVSGDDVYVVWTQPNSSSNNTIKLWKNGTTQNIISGDYLLCSKVFVSGNDTYLLINFSPGIFANDLGKAYLWKNGVMATLSNSGSSFIYQATSMGLSGNDVYICGYEFTKNPLTVTKAIMWKNGVLTRLTDGTKQSNVFKLYVSGADVYITGYEYSTIAQVAKVWKNNIPTSLTDGTKMANAGSVFVSGSDVYITGSEDVQPFNNSPLPSYARYWKNGVPTTLSNGSTVASGGQVFIY